MSIFSINIFGIHIAPTYYGLAYALGFILGYYFLRKLRFIKETELEDLMMYAFFGVILGGRFGYILFYNLSFYLTTPSEILKFWNGGMSFHGGVIGVIIAMIIFSKRYKKDFFDIGDNLVCALPIGLFLGRIGNYINKELLGMPYEGFLAVYKGGIGYFPSPLLEAFLEGIILFFLINHLYKKRKHKGEIGGFFLLFYGIFRFSVEFIRQPDPQLGYISGFLTMGQILSIPMIIAGVYLVYFFKGYPNEK
ncbi:MAG: prolipoprotein diacylglyceryl transferase [Candidatus Gracilibacteria bacterium]|nr:prolipoprotein diacylglyceryl transferase [Candidatus Gracilibacteria bacterium]